MKIAVTIPWREEPTRIPAMHAVERWYRDNLMVDVMLVDSPSVDFNRAGARNECMRQAEGYDIVIINDADTIPEIGPLRSAIEHVQTEGRAQLPYTECHILDTSTTERYLRGLVSLPAAKGFVMRTSVGGTQVTTHEIWEQHGGQDERFHGWGYEDAAWAMAHNTLIGPMTRHKGVIYSLNHNPAPRIPEQMKASGELVYLYEQAKDNYTEMHNLVFNREEH